MKDLVSIVILVYNVQEFLSTCLDSVVCQSYNNLEIILVDDGSTDNSLEICTKYASGDSRIQVLRINKAGVSEARNIGIKAASGEWLCFVDSDDWIESDTIETLLAYAYDYGASIVQGGVIKEYKDHSTVYRNVDRVITYCNVQAMNDICDYTLDRRNSVLMNGLCTKLYRKDLFDYLSFPKGRIWEDVYLQGKLINRSNTIIAVPGIYYHWTQYRKGRISNAHSLSRFTDLWLALKDRYDEFAYDEQYVSIHRKLVLCSFVSIEKCWRKILSFSYKEIMEHKKEFVEMARFVRGHFKFIKYRSKKKQIVLYIACFPSISLRFIHVLYLLKSLKAS